MQCKKCLNKKGGRYCTTTHSDYYRGITNNFYGINYPMALEGIEKNEYGYHIEKKVECPECHEFKEWGYMSKDHIIPITKGGLEFDRENIQWMHLSCNIRKYNHTKEERTTKTIILNGVLNALQIQAIVLEYEKKKQKKLIEAETVRLPPQPKGRGFHRVS